MELALLVTMALASCAHVAEAGPGSASVAMEDGVSSASLARLSIKALHDLAVQLQGEIQDRLLTPDPALVEAHARLLRQEGTGIGRILYFDPIEDNNVNARGGGCYFSFATGEHSFNAEPDIQLVDENRGKQEPEANETVGQAPCHGGFDPAGQVGLLVAIGDIPLDELPDHGRSYPSTLPTELEETWNLLWGEITMADAQNGSAFKEANRDLAAQVSCPRVPWTFLLRSIRPGEHDLLVAFRAVACDERGYTVVWRVLQDHGVPGGTKRGQPPRTGEHAEVPRGPRWMQQMGLPELLSALDAVRSHARDRGLLEVPAKLLRRYEAMVSDAGGSGQSAGVARVLYRHRLNALFRGRDDAASYYSFISRRNSLDDESELLLQPGSGGEEFAYTCLANTALLLDFGRLPRGRALALSKGQAAPAESQEAWDFLRNLEWSTDKNGRPFLSAESLGHAEELGLAGQLSAELGHTYALRSLKYLAKNDHLVVFTVVDDDDWGQTIAWRVVQSWPVTK